AGGLQIRKRFHKDQSSGSLDEIAGSLSPRRRLNRPAEFRDHALLMAFRQFRVNWKRENRLTSSFRLRQVAETIAQIREARLKMQRNRIIDRRPNLLLAHHLEHRVTVAIFHA